MNKELYIEKDISIKAKIDEVWEALTNPEKVKQYFFGTEIVTTWKVGSSLIFQGEWEGKAYQDKGNILALEPNKKLQYNYWSAFSGMEDLPENYSIVSYELSEENGSALLKLSQKGFSNEEAMEHSKQGWEIILNSLKRLVEGEI